MLLGDLNAHHTLLGGEGGTNIDSKGKTIENFLARQNLVYLNDKTPTYVHPGHRTLSTLDLAICHLVLALYLNCNVLFDLYGSDHYPVLLTSSISEPNEKVPHWNFNHADWEKFECVSEERLSVELVEDMNMDRFTSEVHKITEKYIPKSSARKKRPRYPWFF